jgi:folate-binding protein YgfZ
MVRMGDATGLHFPLQKLANRAALAVTGVDAEAFLQRIVTVDVGAATYTALLTPQGKILADFFLVKTADGFLIDCAASQMAMLLQRLSLYKLRADVKIDKSTFEIGAASEEIAGPLSYRDPRDARIGWRCFAEPGTLPNAEGYDAARILLGLAESDTDIGSGQLFPHEANLDKLGGVSFTKGCYIGQEVVSRMEHRGTARNRIRPVVFDGPSPAKGTEIRSGESSIGTVLSSSGNHALALVRLDRLAEATAPLVAGDRIAKVEAA